MDLYVRDLKESNDHSGVVWPMRQPEMYVQLDFHAVQDYFQIFPEDRVKVSFYIEGDGNPRSVSISYDDVERTQPVCEPERVSDEIRCFDTTIYCMSATDKVILRVVASGRILYHKVVCSDLVSGEFAWTNT